MADAIAQRNAEDAIEKRVNEKMAERHDEYLKDLKLEALRESGGPETPATQAKLDELDALSQRTLAASALQQLRPQSLRDIVGQEAAIRALLAKISSPYPQHVILYGPPGVGKTTVARLALEVAKGAPVHAVCQECAVRRGERKHAALGSARNDQSAARQRPRPDLPGQPARIRRGGRSRAETRPRHEGARRRAVHRRDR